MHCCHRLDSAAQCAGSNVDICVITKEGVEYLRNHQFLQGKTYQRQKPVKYKPGTAREPFNPCSAGIFVEDWVL